MSSVFPPAQASSESTLQRIETRTEQEPEVSTARSGGAFLAVLVAVLAFLLASTPVRTSEFWLHLATGRALIDSGFSFGYEPFTTPQNGYWVNPSWLYDVLLFGLYRGLGGSALVIGNALIVAALAVVLMLSARTEKSLFLAGLTTALGLVAVGPWLVVQPRCLSFFFLAWTLWFLEVRRSAVEKNASLVSFWPLLLIFVLWANLDQYFVAGPFLVGLYWLGSFFSRDESANRTSWGSLFVVSLAVGLLNPHHIHILAAPFRIELAGLQRALGDDPSLRSAVTTPLQQIYFSRLAANPAGVAFWLLALAGLISFFISSPRWPWRWGLAWAAFFLLSLMKGQFIPFFVIISVPLVARNFQAWQSRWSPAIFRAAAVATALALVIAAWPGWLQIGPYGPRAWIAEIDPTMRRLEETWRGWQAKQRVPAGTAFNYSPETANYLAWLCPQVKCYVNSHLHVTPEDVLDFRAIRHGLAGRESPGTPLRDWRGALRRHDVSLIVVHGRDLGSITDALSNLFPALRECPLLCLHGRGAIFGWRDPFDTRALRNRILQSVLAGSSALPCGPMLPLAANLCLPTLAPSGDPFEPLRFDVRRAALATPEAPRTISVDREPLPVYWWDAFWRPRWHPSADRDEADTLLTYFDSFRESYTRKQYFLGKFQQAAALTAAGASFGMAPFTCSVDVLAEPALLMILRRTLDDGPMDALYLALRAAHRAIEADPDDAQAYFLLGETYRRLQENTREQNWGPIVGPVRTSQMTAAYRHALILKPELWQAHDRLATIFNSMDYKDLALEELQEAHRGRASRPARGGSREQFQKRQDLVKQQIEALEKQVRSARDRFEVNSAHLRVVDRAHLAGRLGLSGKSLSTLLKSDVAAFGAQGMTVELDLLLNTGEVDKVKSWLVPTHEELLGSYSYNMIKARMEAARGDLAEADKSLTAMNVDRRGGKPEDYAVMSIGGQLLAELACYSRPFFPDRLDKALAAMNGQATSMVLRGVLALEAGADQQADLLFRRALAFWDSPAGADFTDPQANLGRRIAQYFVNALESARAHGKANRP